MNEQELHDHILERMREISEPCPASFVRVMKEEPGLLEAYLKSCGIDCRKADVKQMEVDRIALSVFTKQQEEPLDFTVRFLPAS